MKAIQVTQTGGPEVLTLADVPTRTPKADEALIEIKAIGINFIDVYLREGPGAPRFGGKKRPRGSCY